MSTTTPEDSPARGQLPDTRWTLIARLHSPDTKQVHRALDDLCAQYHYPLYCYIRRRGLDHHDAQDALHDFLAKLLRNDTFGAADADKGRLRTFLLSALQRFLINWRRDQRHRERELSIEAETALAESEDRYQKETFTDSDAPDSLFERKWAQEIMEVVMRRVGDRYESKGKAVLFDVLRPVVMAGGSLVGQDTEALAAAAGIKPGALRMALTRFMEEYKTGFKAEIAQTVHDPKEIKEEFLHLARSFGK